MGHDLGMDDPRVAHPNGVERRGLGIGRLRSEDDLDLHLGLTGVGEDGVHGVSVGMKMPGVTSTAPPKASVASSSPENQ